jgi:hypothetical protein
MHLELTWPDASPLKIWIDGVEYSSPDTPGRLEVDVPISAADWMTYIGRDTPGIHSSYLPDHLPFTLSTSLR